MEVLLWLIILVVMAAIAGWLAWRLVEKKPGEEKRAQQFTLALTVFMAGVAALQLLQGARTSAPPSPTTSAPPSPTTSAPPSPTTSAPPPPPPSSTTALNGGEFTLANYDPVQTYGINVDRSSRSVNGVMFADPVAWAASISADEPYWAEWDLSRKCNTLTIAGVGIADGAPSDSSYLFRVLMDGSPRWSQTIGVGQSPPLKLPVEGVLRLRLSVTGLKKGYDGPYATWGDAKVICASEPSNKRS